MARRFTGTRDSAKVEAEASMTKDEYEGVAEHMRAGMNNMRAKAKARPKPPTRAPETAEQKELKEQIAEKTTACRTLKSKIDKVRKEVNDVSTLLPNIRGKGFPVETLNHFQKQLDEILKEVDTHATFYSNEIIKPVPKADKAGIETVTAATKALDARTTALDTTLTDAKKKVFLDVRKLGTKTEK